MSRRVQLLAVAFLLGLSSAASAYGGLYVFGDSLSDRGNIAEAIGSDPSQVITGNSYIPDKPYASNQFTNGDVWVKPFADALGLAAFGQPLHLGGGDFAFGGASMTTDGQGLPPSLKAQETMFLSGAGGVAPSDALYIIEGGGNDARGAFAAAATADPANRPLIIANAAVSFAEAAGGLVHDLQRAGAQRIVIWNIPDLGLGPAVAALGSDASHLASAVAGAMNLALSSRLALEPDDVSIFDVFGLQNSVSSDPSAFGLSNTTDACGAVRGCDPDTYLFWDGVHPTSGGHLIIAQAMGQAVGVVVPPPVPEPAEYALMLGGMMLLGWRVRPARMKSWT
jgi:outer membrane lipase/esterase